MKFNIFLGVALISAVSNVYAENIEDQKLFNDFSVSGTLVFLTDYYYRGYTQTDGQPAVQGFLRADHNSGLYTQFFASNIQLNIGSSLELDYYLGYDFFLNDNVKLNIQYVDVNYPGSDKSLPSTEFEEYSVAAYGKNLLKESDELSFTFYYSPEYTFQVGKMLRYETSYRYPIDESWNVYTQVGYNKFSDKQAYNMLWATDNKDHFIDYKLGGNFSYQDFVFDLYYANSNINKKLSAADDAVVFSLTKLF